MEQAYKGQRTREHILQQAFQVFNAKGYEATTVSDLMEATGLKKGGIYNHFASKSDLAVEAFEFALDKVIEIIRKRVKAATTPEEKLKAVIEHFELPHEPGGIFQSGCPLMNAAIESDCGFPVLRERARSAFEQLIELVEEIFVDLYEKRQEENQPNPRDASIHLVASMEGALMLTLIQNDMKPIMVTASILRHTYRL